MPSQRIDVAYVPKARDPRLGVMDRMTALGPGMFEYFASRPSRAAVNECLRKRLNFEHELALQAQRSGDSRLPRQWLWILSAGRPQRALREHGAVPMNGWPTGFWRGSIDERLCFVLLRELPEEEDTLFLRLVARGSVGPRAMVELRQLPEDHPLRKGAMPVLIAYQANIMQDLRKVGDMTPYERALEVYQEYEQRIRRDEAQRVRQEEARRNLTRLLTRRFGALSENIVARVQQADHATLESWMDRVLTAQSLDDVFA
ncbi:MAG TPA: DUF4351 domain-containing protein [Haliangium sp.]|nr:DUF4351 domain-containing protein [Haliangium sp.]